ncbi:MAG: FtsX-like permease family protein [Chloroflexi bacterium]|nr:FtsX-like permease family protein [Chloroflexota bacterium]
MTQIATLLIALRGIFSHKLRSFLTVLGVVIGIAAVIALTSVGEGSKKMITDRIGEMGSNLLTVQPGASSMGFVRGAHGSAETLTYEDAMAIADSSEVTAVRAVAPEAVTFAQVIAGGNNVYAGIYGVTPEYEKVRNKTVAEGAFITQSDVDTKALVVVIGSRVAEDLFGTASPIGQTVKLSKRQFTVIGVLKSEGGFIGSDDSIYIPISVVMYRLNPQRTSSGDHVVSTIYLEAVSTGKNDLAIAQVTDLLRGRHEIALGDDDDFSITSQEEIEQTLTETSDTLTALLAITAAIALLVAGIGIMNIMLVSVTERTREIGIRKAVGAKRRNILMQFLLEASAISVIGGLIGIGVGIGASKLISGSITLNMSTIETVITPDTIVLAFFVALGVGIVAGVYPAMRAARLNPIQALRYE